MVLVLVPVLPPLRLVLQKRPRVEALGPVLQPMAHAIYEEQERRFKFTGNKYYLIQSIMQQQLQSRAEPNSELTI